MCSPSCLKQLATATRQNSVRYCSRSSRQTAGLLVAQGGDFLVGAKVRLKIGVRTRPHVEAVREYYRLR